MSRSVITSPREIFFKLLNRLDEHFDALKSIELLSEFDFANEIRTDLFKLEGWTKLFQHGTSGHSSKVFAKIRKQTKELEDALGAVTLPIEIAKDLRKKGHQKLATKFEDRSALNFKKMRGVLKKRNWLQGRISKMRRDLDKMKWPSTEVQCGMMIESIRHECSHLETRYIKELRTPLLADRYDRRILETKMHKFRRQLRWASMYFQIADGLIALRPIPRKLSREERELVRTYRSNPFAKLPRRAKAVASVDALAFYELTRLIDRLGQAKDPAERYYEIKSLTGSAKKARAVYGDAPGDVPAKMHAIMKEYEQKNPLSILATTLVTDR